MRERERVRCEALRGTGTAACCMDSLWSFTTVYSKMAGCVYDIAAGTCVMVPMDVSKEETCLESRGDVWKRLSGS